MENQNQQNAKTVKWNPQDFQRDEPTIGIKFYNINSGETRLATTEALITAFYNSSNLHVNAMVGQDFGWRLAPVTVKRMRDIRDDEIKMDRIVSRFRLTEVGEVTDSHILTYMFQEDLRNAAKDEEAKQNAYAKQYEQDLRDLDNDSIVDESGTSQTAPAKAPRAASQPRLSAAQKKAEAKKLADAKRREDNLANGRDINDGIDMTDEQKAAVGESEENVANSTESGDNKTQS
jgi:hypothetical protein